MSRDIDPKTGIERDNPMRPRIVITPKDSKSAFIRLSGTKIRRKHTGQRLQDYIPARFLDLSPLGRALYSESRSLDGWCTYYDIPGKTEHKPTGGINMDEIDYCRQDVRATVGVLNNMRIEFDRHPIDLEPDRALTSASIAKAYFRRMGLVPPREKFDLPPAIHGIAMQSYYGGRAECRIRHTDVQTVPVDFTSEYPTANCLLGLGRLLTADRLRTEDATEDVRNLLSTFEPGQVYNQHFWKKLCFFALIEPDGDILPVRTRYNGESTNIGINPFKSSSPLWYSGPDIVASTLLTGREPKIIEAIRIVPEGQQKGLRPVKLYGEIDIDPRKQDFFQVVIEERARAASNERMTEELRDAVRYFLKILANAGSYGLFVEINPERIAKGEREAVHVYSGERDYDTSARVSEKPGKWYFPVLGALITGAGRLLLATLERAVADAGGSYMMCDTDSLAIVSSESGGLIRCDGGPLKNSAGETCIMALPWSVVDEIVKRFEQLNPYDRTAVTGSILRIEDVNFADGKKRQIRQQVWGYAIAAKRYVLFAREGDRIMILSPKAHGLGYLYRPVRGVTNKVPRWVFESWQWLLCKQLGLPTESPAWFGLPAMMRFTITTREVLKVLQRREAHLEYRLRTKPFNFIQSPLLSEVNGYPEGVDRTHFTLIAPFESDTSKWFSRPYVNTHDGKLYRLAPSDEKPVTHAAPKTFEDVISRYRWHREAKSLAPDGNPCKERTRGLLGRMPVIASSIELIGKETDRRWEEGEDISILNAEVIHYRRGETARLVSDGLLPDELSDASIRRLAKAAGISETTVKRAKAGKRIQKRKAEALRRAVQQLLSEA